MHTHAQLQSITITHSMIISFAALQMNSRVKAIKSNKPSVNQSTSQQASQPCLPASTDKEDLFCSFFLFYSLLFYFIFFCFWLFICVPFCESSLQNIRFRMNGQFIVWQKYLVRRRHCRKRRPHSSPLLIFV